MESRIDRTDAADATEVRLVGLPSESVRTLMAVLDGAEVADSSADARLLTMLVADGAAVLRLRAARRTSGDLVVPHEGGASADLWFAVQALHRLAELAAAGAHPVPGAAAHDVDLAASTAEWIARQVTDQVTLRRAPTSFPR